MRNVWMSASSDSSLSVALVAYSLPYTKRINLWMMHAITTYNAEALPHPWAENGSSSEAITLNKRYQHPEQLRLERGHSTNPHIPSSAIRDNGSFSAQHFVNDNFSTSSTTTQSQNPRHVKRQCTESLWNTTRQAQPTTGVAMINSQDQATSHLQTYFGRKRAFREKDPTSQCTSQNQYQSSGQGLVKKSRHMVNGSERSDVLMQCDKQEAEEVWNFIGIGWKGSSTLGYLYHTVGSLDPFHIDQSKSMTLHRFRNVSKQS